MCFLWSTCDARVALWFFLNGTNSVQGWCQWGFQRRGTLGKKANALGQFLRGS